MKATIFDRDLTREIEARGAHDAIERENERHASITQSIDAMTADLKKAADDMDAILKMLLGG